MEKTIHDLLAPIVRSFIADRGFALAHRLGRWLEVRFPSLAARVLIGLFLGFGAIASVVTVTALAGF